MVKRFVLKAKNVDNLYMGSNGIFADTVDKALKFVNIDKANKYKNKSLPVKARNYSWETIACEYEPAVASNNNNTFYGRLLYLRDKLSQANTKNEFINETVKYLDSLLKILATKEDVIKYMSKYDSALIDIQHYIEFHTLSKEECIKVIQLQQKVLQKRRICKDRHITINKIENLGLDYWKDLVNQLYGLDNRQYTSRVSKNENKTL